VLRIEKLVTGKWLENSYIVSRDRDAVVIDPGGRFDDIREYVQSKELHIHAVVNTHAHYDHLGAVAPVVAEYGVPFYLHPADHDLLIRANFYRTLFLGEESITIPAIDVELADGVPLRFGALEIDVVHTPGHTPGGACFEIDGEVFTGDTVMAEHLGRTDLPGGDRDVLLSSVQLLAGRYPVETRLHPGHGESAILGDVIPNVLALPELR
jgi:hydroxyacylglutathione hydrolase